MYACLIVLPRPRVSALSRHLTPACVSPSHIFFSCEQLAEAGVIWKFHPVKIYYETNSNKILHCVHQMAKANGSSTRPVISRGQNKGFRGMSEVLHTLTSKSPLACGAHAATSTHTFVHNSENQTHSKNHIQRAGTAAQIDPSSCGTLWVE